MVIGVGLDPLVHDVAQVSSHLRRSRPSSVAGVLQMNLVKKPSENVEGGLDLGDVRPLDRVHDDARHVHWPVAPD